MDLEQRRPPADTQELVAMWNTVKEEHFVRELLPLLPLLLSSSGKLDPEQAEMAARHFVRALYLAATAQGDVHTAMDYLTKVAVLNENPAAS